MEITEAGLNLIKQFEGCRLKAYQDSVGIWTIGYGHTKNVKEGQTITQAQADAFLMQDIATAEKAVNKLPYQLNPNQYSALVSFAFNCGTGNLKKLTDNNNRNLAQISARIPNYNRAGGKILNGLTRRRAAEKALFDKPYVAINVIPENEEDYNMKEIKKSTKGQLVRVWQAVLGFTKNDIDGSFGPKTEASTKALQKKLGLPQTGVVDKATWKAGLESV